MKKKKIYFLIPYPLIEAPSQRFRFCQYLELLDQNHISYQIAPFLSERGWKIYHKKGFVAQKALSIIGSWFKRFLTVFATLGYDYVFIHRETAPIGPPVFEFILSKILRKKIIYDFDDAIWIENFNPNNASFQKLKWYSKVPKIIRWSYRVSVGNEFLANYARQFNPDVVINPTTIDTEKLHNPELFNKVTHSGTVIGWTGTETTAKYLDFMLPVLRKLQEKHEFIFCAISNVDPKLDLSGSQFIKWKAETEIQDLMRFDIGVMPLDDDDWSRGKCGFKALQYMAVGVPAIVSPVGVNTEIVDHKINGFLAGSAEEWYTYLDDFLSNPELYREMGKKAREKVISSYSVQSNSQNFLNLFT